MIKVFGKDMELGSFPDGTILMKQKPEEEQATIEWYYESDRELVALIFLTEHLRDAGIENIDLYMPYIPNARQDRVKDVMDVFTLKYFSKIINSLQFGNITVLDPHSNVSVALLDRVRVISPKTYVEQVLGMLSEKDSQTSGDILMFYPDEGAGKRYSGMVDKPYTFGMKKRDWKSGDIKGLDVAGEIERIAGSDILIVDDICSMGGTFYFSAKRLKELGAADIYLYVTHCENTILRGKLLDSGLLKGIFTTDSIFNGRHEMIHVLSCKK